MVSLGVAQAKTSDQLHSAVASNPDAAAVIVESEISYSVDPYAGTEVTSETTRTIVVAGSAGDSLFVFPPVVDSPAYDDGDRGGGSSQFLASEIAAAFSDSDVVVQSANDPLTSLADQFFGEKEEDALGRELEGVTTVLVNSQEQLDMLAVTLDTHELPVRSIVVQEGIIIPESIRVRTQTIRELQADQYLASQASRHQEAGLDLAGLNSTLAQDVSFTTDREQLRARLEDSGELQAYEAYVAAHTQTEVAATFPEETILPRTHESSTAMQVVNGELIAVLGEGPADILKVTEPQPFDSERLQSSDDEIEERINALFVAIAQESKSTSGTITTTAVASGVSRDIAMAATDTELSELLSAAPDYRSTNHSPEIELAASSFVFDRETDGFVPATEVAIELPSRIDLKLKKLREELGLPPEQPDRSRDRQASADSMTTTHMSEESATQTVPDKKAPSKQAVPAADAESLKVGQQMAVIRQLARSVIVAANPEIVAIPTGAMNSGKIAA